jgi:hypothetical protein
MYQLYLRIKKLLAPAKSPPDFKTDEELTQWLMAKDRQYGGGRFTPR